jgi:hypothetical protein
MDGDGGMLTRTCTHEHVQDGRTALILAAAFGHADCVRVLLDAGADKNVKSNVRVRAFACAVWSRACCVSSVVCNDCEWSFCVIQCAWVQASFFAHVLF